MLIGLTDEQFAEMVRRLPNGACLSHSHTGPWSEGHEWQILAADNTLLCTGHTPEEVLVRLANQEAGKIGASNLRILDDEPTEIVQAREEAFRRGYHCGWIACLGAAQDQGLREEAYRRLYVFWGKTLTDWYLDDCSHEVLPPELKK